MVVVEGLIEGDFLAGVGAEAAHIADDAGFDAAFDFVMGFVVADGIEDRTAMRPCQRASETLGLLEYVKRAGKIFIGNGNDAAGQIFGDGQCRDALLRR